MRNVKSESYSYIESLSENEDKIKSIARENSKKIGLQAISLSPVEAHLLQFHLQSIAAAKVVEIGTLTGLSALYILEVLPENGKLWTLEKEPQHVQLAEEVLREDIERGRCRILEGDARIKLAELSADGPFDAVFIDGNKAAYLDYFKWAVDNVRPGGLIAADNVFLAGAVWGDKSLQKFSDKQVQTVKEMNRLAFADKRFQSVIVPTVEGMLLCKKIY